MFEIIDALLDGSMLVTGVIAAVSMHVPAPLWLRRLQGNIRGK